MVSSHRHPRDKLLRQRSRPRLLLRKPQSRLLPRRPSRLHRPGHRRTSRYKPRRHDKHHFINPDKHIVTSNVDCNRPLEPVQRLVHGRKGRHRRRSQSGRRRAVGGWDGAVRSTEGVPEPIETDNETDDGGAGLL